MKYDVIIVGTGFSGSIIARKLADNLNLRVLILEKRNHIAGNMYDKVDEKGIRVQQYGPHTLITDHAWIVDFIKQYAVWEPWDVTAKVEIDNKLYTLPFNYQFIREYYGEKKAKNLIEKLENAYEGKERVTVFEILDNPDEEIVEFGEMLCQKDYFPYSSKQWGIPMEAMDRSVISRVKFALSEDKRYIQQRYQYIPVNGFTDFFNNILNSEKITVKTEEDALPHIRFDDKTGKALFEWAGEIYNCPIISTGPIDELFNTCYGALPYRSLDIKFKSFDFDSYQDVPFVSYPQAEGYTRIVEYKKLTNQNVKDKTTISIEYPQQYVQHVNQPYYPIINEENLALYEKYKRQADKYDNLFVCGRLGDYKYYNMDAAIERALSVEKEIEEFVEQPKRV